MTPACPDCGSPMELRETTRYRHRDGSPRKFYGCSRWPNCKTTHGAHPDGRPLGVPGDAATKAARIRAHAAFDRLWKEGWMTRAKAYAWLAQEVPPGHIGAFDVEQCERLIQLMGPVLEEAS